MANRNVYVLTRVQEGDVVVDGVFTTEKKAEEYRDNLMEDFGVTKEEWESGSTEYDWEIHQETLQ